MEKDLCSINVEIIRRGIHLTQMTTTYSMLINEKQTLLAVSISTIILHEHESLIAVHHVHEVFTGL